MNPSVLLVFAVLAISRGHAGHVGVLVGPAEPGIVIQGPGSKTSLFGPDGSHISAAVVGGTVVSPPKTGGIVSASTSPGYVAAAAQLTPVAAAVPLELGLHAGVGLAGLGLVAAPGSGLEGQYLHDNTELLYDDGSYKGGAYDSHY